MWVFRLRQASLRSDFFRTGYQERGVERRDIGNGHRSRLLDERGADWSVLRLSLGISVGKHRRACRQGFDITRGQRQLPHSPQWLTRRNHGSRQAKFLIGLFSTQRAFLKYRLAMFEPLAGQRYACWNGEGVFQRRYRSAGCRDVSRGTRHITQNSMPRIESSRRTEAFTVF